MGAFFTNIKYANTCSSLSNRVNSIPVVIDPTVDVLTLKSGHVYSVEGEISKAYNHPIDAVYNHLTYNVYGTEDGSVGYKSIICKEAYSNRLWIKTQRYDSWLSWELVSLATPPQIFNLPLVDGFSNLENVTSAYWKNQFGEATVILQAEKEQLINDGEIAAYLPAGFRPSAPQRFLCLGPTLRRPGFLYVDPDGSIKISFSGNAPSTDVLASFTFVAAT